MSPKQWWPRCSQSSGGPLPNRRQAPVFQKQGWPLWCQSTGGNLPKATKLWAPSSSSRESLKEAEGAASKQRSPSSPRSYRAPCLKAAEAPVFPKSRRPVS